ncbi:MAG TPA: trypsin-like peptidase domain-containing protein [Anaerolineae bacterium]
MRRHHAALTACGLLSLALLACSLGAVPQAAATRLATAMSSPAPTTTAAQPTAQPPEASAAPVQAAPTAAGEKTSRPAAPAVTLPPNPTVQAAGVNLEGMDAVEARRIAIYEQEAPAVVNITTRVLQSDFFFGVTPQEGSGSGFLWDNQGHIVTNNHVVSGAQSIEVSFGGDQTLPATIVGTDPLNDLAVIKVNRVPAGVQPVQVGASSGLKVGQTAIAIGNPFGQFERTLTVGVISALNRTVETDSSVLRGVIQTDAAINRGNSGGPLLDSSGRLIGVNSAIYSPTGTSAGIALAIPVDKVRVVVPALIKDGRFPHPWLGAEQLGYELTPDLARVFNLKVDRGLLVARLYAGSPADKAGVRSAQRSVVIGNRRYMLGGDILTAIDGHKLATWNDLTAYLEDHTEVGQKVSLTIVRDGQEQRLQATLADTPASLQP